MPANPFEVRFDGAVIAGESGGFGLPVVFLHAGVTDRRMWAEQMALLEAEGFHVIAYDRRGFGGTESPDEPFSHVTDLEAVLDSLSIGAAVFVGASMGGALAIDFALENPDRAIALVLIGTAVSGAPEGEVPEEMEELFDARTYAAERKQWQTVNRIDAQVWLDGPGAEAGRVEGEPRRLFLEMNGARLARPALTREEEPHPAYDNLAGLTAPVLLVSGALDFPAILDRQAELEDELENAFAVVLDDTAHLPSLERPDLFDPLLLEFLEAVAGEADEDA